MYESVVVIKLEK